MPRRPSTACKQNGCPNLVCFMVTSIVTTIKQTTSWILSQPKPKDTMPSGTKHDFVT